LAVDEFAFHDARATLWAWPGQNPTRYRDPSGRWGDDSPNATRWGDYAVTHLDEPAMQAIGVGGVIVYGTLGAPVVAPFLEVGAGVELWGALQAMGRTGQIITALLGAPSASKLFPPNGGAGPGQFGPGSLAGKCGDIANATIAKNPNAKMISVPGGFPHFATIENGMVTDPSLRDNLAFAGKVASDIPAGQTVFTHDEWISLVARFGTWSSQ